MRLTEVIRLAKEYLSLGIFSVVIIAVIFFAGYEFLYKRILNGTKRITMKTTLVSGFLLCYCVIVLGATVFSRKKLYHLEMQIQLFSTYREAWNTWSVYEWRNLILNILMFVPLGFLLPFTSHTFKKWRNVYFSGFLFTLLIETVQLITGRGTFEVDDLFNNLLGAMIGYGFYKGICLIMEFIKKRKKNLKGFFLSQIPLIIAVSMFLSIFLSYEYKNYGNLSESYSIKQNMKKIEVTTALSFSTDTTSENIFQLDILRKEDTKQIAQEFFRNLGVKLDENRIRYFHDAGTFFSEGGEHYICVRYQGGTLSYKNFKLQTELEQGTTQYDYDVTYEELMEALENLKLFTPESGNMITVGEGKYSIAVKNTVKEHNMYGGIIDCIFARENKISYLDYGILMYDIYDQCDIYSEKEAYEKILEGKFNNPIGEELFAIEILSVHLEQALDSKGYLQPVYAFEVKCNDSQQLTKISIPALKE
ncbi:MAG: VanZ family protein [Lachnospiraceae bacterium]|nr:VanZ family protein [Lachnospiraceae bacterium]